MMNFLKLAAIYSWCNVCAYAFAYGQSILKWFKTKFHEIQHIPGTFHCNVTQDFRNKTTILGDMIVIQSNDIKRVV